MICTSPWWSYSVTSEIPSPQWKYDPWTLILISTFLKNAHRLLNHYAKFEVNRWKYRNRYAPPKKQLFILHEILLFHKFYPPPIYLANLARHVFLFIPPPMALHVDVDRWTFIYHKIKCLWQAYKKYWLDVCKDLQNFSL